MFAFVPQRMSFFRLVPVVVLLAATTRGQIAPEIAYDLFNYVNVSYKTQAGGAGFRAGSTWAEQTGNDWACNSAIVPVSLIKATTTTYAQGATMVGTEIGSADYCGIWRPLSGSPFAASAGTVFVSALFMSVPANGTTATSRDGAFAIGVGDEATLKGGWENEGLNFWISGTAVVALRASKMASSFTFKMSNGGATRTFNASGGATAPYGVFVVLRLDWTDSNRLIARNYPFDVVNGSTDVSEAHVTAAPNSTYTLPVDKITGVSFGTYRFFASQLRIGTTFSSVYSSVPSGRVGTTTTSTTTTSTSTSTTTSTTTTTTSSTRTSATVPMPTVSSVSISPRTTSSPTSSSSAGSPTTNSGVPRSTASASHLSLPTPFASDSSTDLSSTAESAPVCELEVSSCTSCLAMRGCKWCSTGDDTGRCISTSGEECVSVTQLVAGCSAQSNDVVDEASLSAAVVGGAVGGSIAALLLIALVIFLVFRFRKSKNNPNRGAGTATMTSDEMTTTRESASMGNSHYGDLRLTSQYSTTGLQVPTVVPSHYVDGSGASSGGSGDQATPTATGTGTTHYTALKMN